MFTEKQRQQVRKAVHPRAHLTEHWRGWPIIELWNTQTKRLDRFIGHTLGEAIAHAKSGEIADAADLY